MAYVKKTIYEKLYEYQTRLQGVANDLGIKLAAVVSGTDKDVLDILTKEIPKESKETIKGEIKRLQEITSAVEQIRKKSFDAAKDTLLSTSFDVAKAGASETAKEFNAALGAAARAEREKRFSKELSDSQLKAIIDGQGIDGATIGEWFDGWQRSDLERISRVVQTATVEQLSVQDIAKQIRGTKENNYNDGILATTRVGAVRLARTVVNGVSNNARVETIKENSDVIDGIKFVGTLDGKTCPHCASYDGHIWRGEDMASARRPPIHPNCRCTLVPYVELKDDDGNIVDIDSERPAANADFDQLAKDAYNQKAKEKGWKRRFEDLSPSTRLKYYYQAQKDYEKQTGKPAYRQVDSNLSFQEYFKQQPDSFKRAWLGAKRYEAYKDGKLSEKSIFNPDLGYTVSPTSLVKFVEPEVPDELVKLIDEYEKKGSTALPNPTSGNAIDYTKFVPDYDGETNVDTLRKRWEKLDLQELEKLPDDIWERSKAWRSYIWDFQPKKGDFSTEEDYDKALKDYLRAYHHVFWGQLDDVVRELIEEAKKKTIVRVKYPSADYNGSTDVKSLLQSWEALGEDELTALQEDIKSKGNTWSKQLADSYPTRSTFETQESYQDSVEQWNKIYNQGQTFWNKLQNGVSKLIKTLKDKASGKKTQKDKVDTATVKTENAEKTNGFQHPFDSMRAPDDYLKDQKIKEELDRINKQYSEDVRTYGVDEALEKKREGLRSLILPLPPDEKVEKDLHSRLPKQFKGRNITQDKRTDEFIQATKDGLTFFARLLRNLGRDGKSVRSTKIVPMLEQRAYYSPKKNKVHLSYSSRKSTLAIATTAAHEFGHALDNKGSGKILEKIQAFYEQHSKKDSGGNYIYFYRNGEKCRELDINVPFSYACREYELWNGTRQTELTSVFSEMLYSSPETFFDPQYREYYTGVLQCLKAKK